MTPEPDTLTAGAMQVIATAGHVDHGKSTLVRALTGMEPDRWAEERRRGMTIDLGYAWTRLPSGARVAFVDVPGHERFTTNMLAGVGPVPAVLLVIAADAGWGAQTDEHVRALDALGVRDGLLAITRCDLADPGAATAEARRRLQGTSLAGLPALAVSGSSGEGLPELVAALDELVTRLPRGDAGARVRLWVDRSFTIRGSGTVVTGTLGEGTLHRGDLLELRGAPVAVRGLHSLGEPLEAVSGPARVAVNLRGVDVGDVRRGDALLTPGAWRRTRTVDVRTAGLTLPLRLVAHAGSAAVPARVRPLASGAEQTGHGAAARLLLDEELPLRVGDRILLRDPGLRHVLGGATVADPLPPPLHRRGAARARALALAADAPTPTLRDELRRRGAAEVATLDAIGVPLPDPLPDAVVAAGRWLCDAAAWEGWRQALSAAVARGSGGSLVDAGVPQAELARSLGLPDAALLTPLLSSCPELEEVRGRVRLRGAATSLRADLQEAVERLRSRLDGRPFSAPEQAELAALGLGRRELGAAAAAGAVLRLPGDVVLLPDAPAQAVALLGRIEQPFTLSTARQALGTTRRVAVPLLEHLDTLRLTERVDTTARRLTGGAGAGAPPAGAAGRSPRGAGSAA